MASQKKFRIKKGDQVVIRTGKDKGRKGEVLKILTTKDRVIVSGLNMVKRHTKPNPMAGQGGIIAQEASIHISNVALADPKTGNPTRVGYKTLEDGRKVRVAKASGEVVDA